MNTALAIKNTALTVMAGIGTTIATFMGGWDMALQTLLIFMALDYISGLTVALVFKKSGKTESGAASSNASFKGIIKKVFMLVLVIVAVCLDNMLGTPNVARTALILFLVGNEGLSILENLGLMGVPFPTFVKNALAMLKEKNDNIEPKG